MMFNNHKHIKNTQYETKIFINRIVSAVIIVLLMISVIFARFFYLQIVRHDSMLASSEKNRIRTTALPPARGFIYDRNNKLLVDNIPTYRLQVIPEKVDQLRNRLTELKKITNLSDEEIDDVMSKEKSNSAFKPIIIKDKLSEKEMSAFVARKHRYPGFEAKPYLIRHYKYTNILSHVVGYVGRLNEQDSKRLDKNRYLGTEYTGRSGLEKYHENILHGYPGSLKVETNAKGRVLSEIKQELPTSGKDITLTIDIDLQNTAYEALGDLTGSIIAIDPNNGEILAMVSKPGFDPNDFVNGISQSKYSGLLNSPEKPLFDRSIKGGYEPGSTIKPYVALAGLYNEVIDLNYSMLSKGYFQLKNQKRKYHDWKRGGHGLVNIQQSIAQSVNTFYYQLALNLGIDRIHNFLIHFRFGQLSNIELQGEMKGLLPSREWKKKNKGTIWFPGETVITGIGQGFLVSTPVQLVTSLGIMANKGKYIKPHLIKSDVLEQEDIVLDIPDQYWQAVHDGMIGVVNDAKGSAYAIRKADYIIAGKSGTSQVYGKKEEDVYNKNLVIPKHLRNHALFVAFAPADDPKIAVVVVAEHGASGSRVAGPIAGQVIEKYMQSYDHIKVASSDDL